MAVEKRKVSELKEYMDNYIGHKVILRYTEKRKKAYEKVGTLVQTYPEHFLVKLDNSIIKEDFRYAQILTNQTILEIPDSDGAYSSIHDTNNTNNTINTDITL